MPGKTIEQRLRCLERRYRRSQCVVAMALAALGLVALSGQGKPKQQRQKEVRAETIYASRVVLTSDQRHDEVITIDDKDGVRRILVSADGIVLRNKHAKMVGWFGKGKVQLGDPGGRGTPDNRRVYLGVAEGGGGYLSFVNAKQEWRVRLEDDEADSLILGQGIDEGQIVAEISKSGVPSIRVLDSAGVTKFSAPSR